MNSLEKQLMGSRPNGNIGVELMLNSVGRDRMFLEQLRFAHKQGKGSPSAVMHKLFCGLSLRVKFGNVVNSLQT